MKLHHLFTPYTRINSKCIKNLNVTPGTIKILEENIGSRTPIFLVALFFLMYLLGQRKQKKKTKLDYIKLKSLCTAKEAIHKIKRQLTE